MWCSAKKRKGKDEWEETARKTASADVWSGREAGLCPRPSLPPAARLNEMSFHELHEKCLRWEDSGAETQHLLCSGRWGAAELMRAITALLPMFLLIVAMQCACNRLEIKHGPLSSAASRSALGTTSDCWTTNGMKGTAERLKVEKKMGREETFKKKKNVSRCEESCLQRLKCIVKILYMGEVGESRGGGSLAPVGVSSCNS